MTINNIARNEMSPAMTRIASGRRINTAADDAAGLAIVETMTAQIRGLDQGTRNTMDMQALTRTAEGGLEGIADGLNRIRELSVQAMNDTNTPENREMIQQEMYQLATEISDSVSRVQFNTREVLNSDAELHTASSADGSGATVNISNMTSLAQAITNFATSGTPGVVDLDAVDGLLNEVNAERANLGALQNRFDHTVASNTITSLNMADSRSRIQDADIAREMMAFTQERVIYDMQLLMQQAQQEREEREGTAVIAGARGA